jgi:hypothetical protein
MVRDWAIPHIWNECVSRQVAVQGYLLEQEIGRPEEEWNPNVKRNVTKMRQINVGDQLLARRSGKDFFLGYGRVLREIDGSKIPVEIQEKDPDTGELFADIFVKWLDVEWFALSTKYDDEWGLPWPNVRDEYPDLKFTPGLCVRKIARESFLAVKKALDQTGAIRTPRSSVGVESAEPLPPTLWDSLDAENMPARMVERKITVRVRDPRNRLAAKKRARWKCEVPRCRIPVFLQQDTQRAYVEAHHLDPLADEGVEHLSNIAVVCAWHHALLTHGPEREAKKVARQLKAVRAAEKKRR